MPLSAGTRFGSYEISALIGVGGMGEVYRATDTKLGREVAIKTLPAEFASDKDRLARFEREAKLLAALNHAHIASVYGLDEHEGTLYLAMELVDGETLERKLASGRLPIEEALRLALQIAEALEAAHEKGVVHRDLKPANIMVSRDGQVKVLDFGLAKSFSADPSQTVVGHSPALSLAMTQHGLVLGTAGYMSPEQASGQATDQRADIWAFGVVLYEMLAGKPLYSGESVPHVLADVLKTEPDWSGLPKNLHPRLRQLLERCLEKNVRDRYHSIADVRVDVEETLSDPTGVTQTANIAAAGASSSGARVGAAVVVTGIVAALIGWAVWPAAAPRPMNRFDWAFPPNISAGFMGQVGHVFALSPDGRQFVYSTPQGLYVRAMNELVARVIPGTERENAIAPFFSPDSQSVAYFTFGQLKRIGLRGGAPSVVAGGLAPFSTGASWGPDDTILFGQVEGIFRVLANGGKPELVIPAHDEMLYDPELLPDKDSVLFSTTPGTDFATPKARVVVQKLSTGTRTTLVDRGIDARYVPSGHLVYAVDEGLFAIAFDASRLAVSGAPVPMVQGVLRGLSGGPVANYGISTDGTLVYVNAPRGNQFGLNLTFVWVDHEGHEEPLGLEPCVCLAPTLSPDGTRVALQVVSQDRQSADIWVWSLAQRTLQHLPAESGLHEGPLWTPDSAQIVYSTGGGMTLRHADGTGAPERLFQGNVPVAWSWSADGDLIFNSDRTAANASIEVVPAGGDRKPKTLLPTDFRLLDGALSPDSHWLAYESSESGHYEIVVRPYPDVEAHQWVISSGGGEEPKWTRDGRTLFFRTAKSLMAAAVDTTTGFSFRKPEPVLDITAYTFLRGPPRTYDVSPDGQRFLLVKSIARADADSSAESLRAIIVQNWTEELKRLVPRK